MNDGYGLSHTTVFWILSRTPVLSEDKMMEAQALLKSKVPDYSSSIWPAEPYQGADCPYGNWDQA